MIPVSKECLVYGVGHKMPRKHRGAHDRAGTAQKGVGVKEGSCIDVLVEF